MNPRIKIISLSCGKLSKRECEVLHRDDKLLIARPVPDKFNELLIFYAHGHTDGFSVVLPGESVGVNLCEVGVPRAFGRYKLDVDGSMAIEIDSLNYPATCKVVKNQVEKEKKELRGLRGKKSKKS